MSDSPSKNSIFSFMQKAFSGDKPWWFVLIAAAAAVAMFSMSCATPAVMKIEFDGDGTARTDGDAIVATGEFEGEVKTWIKGFPAAPPVPIFAGGGTIFYHQLSTGDHGLVLDSDDLPEWAGVLLLPGEHIPPLED